MKVRQAALKRRSKMKKTPCLLLLQLGQKNGSERITVRKYALFLRHQYYNVVGPEPESVKKVTYILAILSASEAKKTPAKRETKTASVRLNTDKSWDTLKAQILVKIDAALHPKPLEFANYDVNYYIARVLPKPGLSLMSDEDYDMLIDRVKSMKSKDPEVHVGIVGKKSDANKENVDATGGDLDDVEEVPKSKGKKVRLTKLLYLHLLTSQY
jgi:hypothetical protein